MRRSSPWPSPAPFILAELYVPRETPSLNDLLGSKRYRNPHDYKRLRELWARELAVALGGAPQLNRVRAQVRAAKKLRLRILCKRKRLLDPDNLKGGLKPIVDAAKNLGLLLDDNADVLDYPDPQQEKRGSARPLTILIIELVA